MKLILSLAIVLIVASISMCGYKLYNVVVDFPEEARIENLNQRYATLVKDLNRAIEKSESAYSLASKLENISYPSDTLSVSLRKDSDDELPILNRFESTNTSRSRSSVKTVFNGGGYGRKNGQHFWILQHPVNRYEYDEIEILFKRPTPDTE